MSFLLSVSSKTGRSTGFRTRKIHFAFGTSSAIRSRLAFIRVSVQKRERGDPPPDVFNLLRTPRNVVATLLRRRKDNLGTTFQILFRRLHAQKPTKLSKIHFGIPDKL